jgi:hypothetical protein
LLLLIRAKSRDVATLGGFDEQRVHLGHEREFGLRAGFPTEVERGHEIAELFAIENHALQDAVYEGVQRGGGEVVLGGDAGQFLSVFFRFEAGVTMVMSIL